MSIAEIFLLVWAVLATCFGAWVHGRAKHYYTAHKMISFLVAELATGEIKATQDKNGVWTVENDGMVMKFRKGDNHGL